VLAIVRSNSKHALIFAEPSGAVLAEVPLGEDRKQERREHGTVDADTEEAELRNEYGSEHFVPAEAGVPLVEVPEGNRESETYKQHVLQGDMMS
jgi:hypothetical protein